MQLNRPQAELLHKVLTAWENAGKITAQQARELKESYTVRSFDWKMMTRYCFIIAILLGVAGVVATFADRALIRFFQSMVDKIYNAPNFILAVICAVIGFIFFYFGEKNKQAQPSRIFTNEGFILLGATFTAFTAANLAAMTGTGDIYYITVFLAATLLYLGLSLKLKNALLWLFTLISFTVWLGVLTGVSVHWKAYFLGMNFPVRYILIGAVLLTVFWQTRKFSWWKGFYPISHFYSLLLLFTALWTSSVFGNTANFDIWSKTPQWHYWPWALLSTGWAAAATYWGSQKQQLQLRSFGIAFLFLNIYTRCFEYFWEGTPKAVFFIALAVSFWLIGRRAEKIWHLDLKGSNKQLSRSGAPRSKQDVAQDSNKNHKG